ncbi:phosphotransferase family protein [Umezawaea beigongshangensis]|uniref:phosphotransferase family protein n=1 Tax=Umezawaea beigongshangensis TaxID=2780383 RepID=UPI0018F1690E|nr:phosphotransferase [Umezawaea beigongshangensis]
MDIRSKRRLDQEELRAVARRALGRELVGAEELTGGMFNASYLLTTDDGTRTVLKVGPPPDVPLMRYEGGLMDTETRIYRVLRDADGVPVPSVLHAEDGLLLLTALRGTPWWDARERLTDEHRALLRRDLGGVLASLHRVRGEFFGYPRRETGLCASTWREAFTGMVDALLEDARRFGVALEPGVDDVLARHADVLDEVTEPALVHFDLWEGNVFLDLSGDRPRIEAVIDHERAFWGDPLADLIAATMFRELDEELVAGYRDAGGELELTAAARTRMHLYRVYLYSILIVEGVPRGYSGDEHDASVRFYREQLTGELAALADG